MYVSSAARASRSSSPAAPFPPPPTPPRTPPPSTLGAPTERDGATWVARLPPGGRRFPRRMVAGSSTLVKKLHPDTNKGDADAERKFQEVQQAYETLKDEQKRVLYDQVGPDQYEKASAGGGGPGGPFEGGFGNPFEDIFGGGGGGGMNDFFNKIFRDREVSEHDAKVALELSFMEAVQGCTKTINFQTFVTCETCKGAGVPPGTKPETCLACRGSGFDANNMHTVWWFREECKEYEKEPTLDDAFFVPGTGGFGDRSI